MPAASESGAAAYGNDWYARVQAEKQAAQAQQDQINADEAARNAATRVPDYSPGSPAQPAAAGQASAPSAPSGPAAPGATQQAMQGLQQAVTVQDQSGPAPGWASDPALAQTAGDLGTTIPSQAMGALSAMTKRGIY